MNEVATKGIKAEFDKAGRVTLEAKPDRLVASSTNGHLWVTSEVTGITDPNLKITTHGKLTVDSAMAKRITSAIGGRKQDNILSVEVKDGNLQLQDLESRKDRKSLVKMPIITENHDFSITAPKGGFKYTFSTDALKRGFNAVSKYYSKLSYRLYYQMVCIHFLPDEIRFVCGDGPRFGVYVTYPTVKPVVTDATEGFMALLPVDQGSILLGLLENADTVDIVYKDATSAYFRPSNGMEVELKGIPSLQYIAYHQHAFRHNESKAVIDVAYSDLEEAVQVIMSVRDKEIEDEGTFHSFLFDANKGGPVNLTVTDRRYTCDFACPATFYSLKADSYKAEYAARFLQDLYAVANGKGFVRFYGVDENVIMLAESVDLDENKKDANGLPGIKREPEDSRLIIFFSPAKPDDN